MALHARGIVSAVQIAVYVPLLLLALLLVIRHGTRRDAGWIFLAIFSIFRIVGASLLIALEESQDPPIALFITTSIFVSIGTTALLLATSGFLGIVGQNSEKLQEYGPKSRVSRIIQVAILVAIILSIIAGTETSSTNPDTLSHASTYRKVAGILILVIFIGLVGLHLYCWVHRDQILYHRRRLLIGISSALPFFFVRVLYSFIGALQSNLRTASFNPVFGNVVIYIVMGVVMEFITALIYIVVGLTIPLDIHTDLNVSQQQPYAPSQAAYPAQNVPQNAYPPQPVYAPSRA